MIFIRLALYINALIFPNDKQEALTLPILMKVLPLLFSLILLSFGLAMSLHTAAAPPIHTITPPKNSATKFSLRFGYRSHSINLSHILTQEYQRFQILSDSMAIVTPISSEFVASLNIGLDEVIQRVSLIVDPGSSSIWWQCNCDAAGSHCYKQKEGIPLYNKDSSKSYSKLKCSDPRCPNKLNCRSEDDDQDLVCIFYEWYADGSGSYGILSTEHLMLETESEPLEVDILFGCGEDQTISVTDALNEASGMLGLSNHPLSLTNQLNASAFSVCLPSRISNDSSSIDFHTVWSPPCTMGKECITTDLIQPPSPLKNEHGFYYVDILQVQFGSDTIDVPQSLWGFSAGGSGTIVDYGTTLTYFPIEAYRKLRDLFTTHVRNNNPELIPIEVGDLEACYRINPPDLVLNCLNIPPITITFRGGVKYEARVPDQVMVKMDHIQGACLAIRPTTRNGTPPSILGNILFQRTRTHFALKDSLIAFESNGCNFYFY